MTESQALLSAVEAITSAPRVIRVVSRKSKLALIQTNLVVEKLKATYPQYAFSIVSYDTVGDRVLNKALAQIGEKGLFTQELEADLLAGRADLAVHSLKDMPTKLPDKLILGAITERANPEDVFVLGRGKEWADVKHVGTSSIRRRAQLDQSKYECVDIRGNLETRLHKLDEGSLCDAIVLARAGLERQGLADRIAAKSANMFYAVGQGALGIECRQDDTFICDLIRCLHHSQTAFACTVERTIMATLEGGCHTPIGVRSSFHNKDDDFACQACVLSLDGSKSLEVQRTFCLRKQDFTTTTVTAENWPLSLATRLGESMGLQLLESGARAILQTKAAALDLPTNFSIPSAVADTSAHSPPSISLQNDTFVRACKSQPVDYVPVWLMRQAGRYLPGFKALRQKHTFFDMCYTPALSAEATLEPLETLGVDALIHFSDILVIPRAMGFTTTTIDTVTAETMSVEPRIINPVRSDMDAERSVLQVENDTVIAKLAPIYAAIEESLRRIAGRVPLIGFAGAPWTLFAYMIEGSSTFSEKQHRGKWAEPIAHWLYEQPALAHQCLNKLANIVALHLIEQIRHGVHVVQIFDSNTDALTAQLFEAFALPYLRQVIRQVASVYPEVPVIVFARGQYPNNSFVDYVCKTRANVISLDQYADLAKHTKDVSSTAFPQGNIALQGNLDPLVLHCTEEVIRQQTEAMLKAAAYQNSRLLGFVANLGHGCLPTFDPVKVRYFTEAVHTTSKRMISENRASLLSQKTV